MQSQGRASGRRRRQGPPRPNQVLCISQGTRHSPLTQSRGSGVQRSMAAQRPAATPPPTLCGRRPWRITPCVVPSLAHGPSPGKDLSQPPTGAQNGLQHTAGFTPKAPASSSAQPGREDSTIEPKQLLCVRVHSRTRVLRCTMRAVHITNSRLEQKPSNHFANDKAPGAFWFHG